MTKYALVNSRITLNKRKSILGFDKRGLQIVLQEDPQIIDYLKKAGYTFIDETNYCLMPSFVDSHVHLCGINPLLKSCLEENVKLNEISGVFCVRDCGSPTSYLDNLKNHQNGNTTLLTSGRPITIPNGHLSYIGRIAQSRSELEDAVMETHNSGAGFVKICASGGDYTFGGNPRVTQYSKDQLRIIVQSAAKLGMKVATHAHSTKSILNCIDAGVHSIEHCSFLDEGNSTDFKREYLEMMAERGIYFVATITENGYSLKKCRRFNRERIRKYIEYYSMLYKTAIELEVPFILATDAWGKGNRYGGFGDMLTSVIVDYGLSFKDVVKASTETPRRMMNEFGLEDNRKGFLVLEGNPEINPDSFQKVKCIIPDITSYL